MTTFKFNDPNQYRLVSTGSEAKMDPDYMALMQYIKDNSKTLKQMLSSMVACHLDKAEMAREYEKFHRKMNPGLYE